MFWRLVLIWIIFLAVFLIVAKIVSLFFSIRGIVFFLIVSILLAIPIWLLFAGIIYLIYRIFRN